MAKKSDPVPLDQLTSQLEAIIESLQDDKLPIEDAIAAYESGTKLLKTAQQQLESAEQRIKMLELSDKPPAA